MSENSAMKDEAQTQKTQLTKSLLQKVCKAPRKANSLSKALNPGKYSLSLIFCRKSISNPGI